MNLLKINWLTILEWLLATTLLIYAFHLNSPFLLKIREISFLSILLFCLILGGTTLSQLYQQWKRRPLHSERLLFLLLILIIVTVTAVTKITFLLKRQTVLEAPLTDLQTFGQHLIIGYTDPDDILPLVQRGAIGGIFVTRRNVQQKSLPEIQTELRELQAIQASLGLAPLFIVTDQEGGLVSRLSPPLTELPSLSSLINSQNDWPTVEQQIKQYGHIHGKELSQLGINVNLAPIVDLKHAASKNKLDFHTLIQERAISQDKSVVAKIALLYSQGLQNYKVFPTLKHFPGIGRVQEDTHYYEAELDLPIEELEREEWLPFRYVLSQVPALMMLSHVKLTAVDPINPVSYSYRVIQGIIREQWQYQGLLITDDFNMWPIYYGAEGIGSATLAALNAGVDLILLSYDGEQYYEVMYEILTNRKNLDRAQLMDSQKRLALVKSSL